MNDLNQQRKWLRVAQVAWLLLIGLTIVWDGVFAPLYTGRWLLLVKLLPLCLPLRGIVLGRIYTYQYCSMLILAYFAEGVMRLFDVSVFSRCLAGVEIGVCVLFFVACLLYLKQFKQSQYSRFK